MSPRRKIDLTWLLLLNCGPWNFWCKFEQIVKMIRLKKNLSSSIVCNQIWLQAIVNDYQCDYITKLKKNLIHDRVKIILFRCVILIFSN
jgi:hypothetical protein